MKSITVASGKGGVGKTSFVINLSIALSSLNKKVLVFDADISLANIDVMLGLSPKYDIRHVINGSKELKDVVYSTQYKFDFIPGGSGIYELSRLNLDQKIVLKEQMEEVLKGYDFLIFDNAAGISDNVLFFNALAEERIFLCTPEPTSIADVYALIKVSYRKYNLKRFFLVVTMTKDKEEGRSVYRQLIQVLKKFMPEVSLSYLGCVENDECVKKAIRAQKPYFVMCPDGKASSNLKEIALKLLKLERESEKEPKIFENFVRI